MRYTVLKTVAACALVSGAMAIPASAADLDYYAPPAPLAPIWQGFYVGGHIGFGEADLEGSAEAEYTDDVDEGLDESVAFRQTLTPDGLVGGGQAGYNWQFNQLVFGIEGDISFTDWGESSVVFEDEPLDDFGLAADATGVASAEIDMLASVRGRLGMAFDNVLVYGTGGVAWADAEARGHLTIDDGINPPTESSVKESFDDMGFVAGGGLAWMVIPQTFSVGLEGLYYWFDQDETLFEETIDVGTGDLDVRATATLDDAWVIRARGDFHF